MRDSFAPEYQKAKKDEDGEETGQGDAFDHYTEPLLLSPRGFPNSVSASDDRFVFEFCFNLINAKLLLRKKNVDA